MSNTLTEKKITGDVIIGEGYTLMLYNDDVHTFSDVINALIEICGHSPEQAEQCTFLVHHKGKCDVKRGTKKILNTMSRQLAELGLTTAILN